MRNMRNIMVIRFGSLGDLCLLGWSLARLAEAPGSADRTVTLVTKASFAPLADRFRGIDRVITLDSPGFRGLLDLAAVLRGAGSSSRLDRTMRRRFDELVDGLVNGLPAEAGPPLAHLARDPAPEPVLGLAPGAQWDTKRWPEGHFARLLTLFRERHAAPVRIFLGPREERWFPGSPLDSVAGSLDRVTIFRNRPLPEVADLLAGCRTLVTNDSGLLHLAEATGTPVLAFFGPTVRQFGYFPCLADSRVLEVDLDCRPCSRNGKRSCHRRDLACLNRIEPESALPHLDRMFRS